MRAAMQPFAAGNRVARDGRRDALAGRRAPQPLKSAFPDAYSLNSRTSNFLMTTTNNPANPLVGVLMGSSSDWDTMQHAVQILEQFGVAHEARVVSAHRMPDELFAYAEAASGRGLQAIIAGAGGAAHLPGMLAAKTTLPVLGVPVAGKHLQGVDSLHSMVQMPKGVPIATFAIGNAGAANAALFAVAMLALHDQALNGKLQAFRLGQTEAARAMTLPPA
jgi:5-(carboxyamino)imidazole ribonucleotide mutase